MKLLITILFIMFSCNIYGQKWHLNGVDETSLYKYEYWLRLDNVEDTSSFVLKIINGQIKPTLQIRNNNGETIESAVVRIKNLNSGVEYEFLSKDSFNVNLKQGDYSIIVSGMDYDRFSADFKLNKHQTFYLDLKLGSSNSVIYQINSIDKLNDGKMDEIINCIKDNKTDYYNKCSEKCKFRISMHI